MPLAPLQPHPAEMNRAQFRLPHSAGGGALQYRHLVMAWFWFKIQFSRGVNFSLAWNQSPPAKEKLVAEFPWRRECQLGESERKSDKTYMNRRVTLFSLQYWRARSEIHRGRWTPNSKFKFSYSNPRRVRCPCASTSSVGTRKWPIDEHTSRYDGGGEESDCASDKAAAAR